MQTVWLPVSASHSSVGRQMWLLAARQTPRNNHRVQIKTRNFSWMIIAAELSTEFSQSILICRVCLARIFPVRRYSGFWRFGGFRRLRPPNLPKSDSSRMRSIDEKGDGVAEKKQSNEDELFQLTVCAALAFVAAASLAGPYLDGMQTISSIAALIHLRPFGLLVNHMDWLRDALYFGKALFEPAAYAYSLPIEFKAAAELSHESRKAVLAGSGAAAAILYGPCFIWMAASCRGFRPDLAHRTVHDLASLIRLQCKRWPQANYARRYLNLMSGSGKNPSSDVNDEHAYRHAGQLVWTEPPPLLPPPSSCSMRPEDWLEAQGYVTRRGRNNEFLSDEDCELLSEEDLCEAFERQLGKPWRCFAQLAPCKRALAAAFACFHNYESEYGHDLLNRLSRLAAGGSADKFGMDEAISRNRRLFAEIGEILGSSRSCGLKRIAGRHAWETTAMIAMLMAARKDRGVLASASFLWLKREDRGLWYALNNAGNAAIMAEAAGALAHFRAERQIGRPLRRPATRQAAASFLENYFDAAPERVAKRRSLARFRTPVGTRLEQLASNP